MQKLKSFGVNCVSLQLLLKRHRDTGDLWLLSNDAQINFSMVDSMQQTITFSMGFCGRSWVCSAVYASLVLTIRTSLWRYLEELHDRIKSLGDFNEVALVNHRWRVRFTEASVEVLPRFCCDHHLMLLRSNGFLSFTSLSDLRLVGQVMRHFTRLFWMLGISNEDKCQIDLLWCVRMP